MNTTRSARRTPASPRPPGATIAFRLDEESRAALAGRAGALGVSCHELARNYVLEALSAAEERVVLHENIAALAEETTLLRRDLATAVLALLTSAGRVELKAAVDWVKTNLTSSCSPSPTP